MDDRVGDLGRARGRVPVLGHGEEGGEGVEDLARVGEVRFHGVDVRVVEGDEVEVEDLVPLREEVGDHVPPGFAGAAGEDDAFA